MRGVRRTTRLLREKNPYDVGLCTCSILGLLIQMSWRRLMVVSLSILIHAQLTGPMVETAYLVLREDERVRNDDVLSPACGKDNNLCNVIRRERFAIPEVG